jgi:hypothetical protein
VFDVWFTGRRIFIGGDRKSSRTLIKAVCTDRDENTDVLPDIS